MWLKAYVSVLVSGDGYKLVLGEGEGLSSGLIAHVLHAVLCHLHNVQPWLVFMKRLQNDHLQKGEEKKKKNSKGTAARFQAA